MALPIFAQSYDGPESVEYDPAGNRYFISNAGNSEILVRNSAGVLSVFTSLPSSPHGLHIAGTTLYVCDGGSVKGYDLGSGVQVMNINVGGTFLNGLTGDGGNNLFATDFTAKKIYRIDIVSQSYNIFVPQMSKSPNGIIYDGANSRLIFVCWGSNAPIYQVLLADSSLSQITTTTLSNCDGITRDCNGNYYVSAWGTSALHKFNNTFTGGPTTFTTGLSSPADICYNISGDTIAIPNSGNNTVTFVYTNCIGAGVDELEGININAHPNPANEETVISYSLSSASVVKIELVDIAGKAITVLNEDRSTGVHNEKISTKGLAAGVYLYRLHASGRTYTGKLVVGK